MALSILHTGDWHLGATLHDLSRDPEHARFIDWLLQVVNEREIDVVVVAGDVFEYTQPSAEALALYYDVLARLATQTGVRQVVVVGGNHDSPSRLDAPREVLSTLGVHVVGGLGSKDEWQRAICPIRSPEDERVEAAIVAVPYIHEFRLGVRSTAMPVADVQRSFTEAFTQLYRTMTNLAVEAYPGVPLIGTGHLTCAGAAAAEYGTPIHQVATIGGLAPTIFDPRLDYVALGHIHRMYNVEGSSAWYCGSPIALDVAESRSDRHVIEVTVGSDGAIEVEAIPVPVWRDIVELSGNTWELTFQLQSLDWQTPLPPIVYADVDVDHYTPGVDQSLREALDQFEPASRPTLARVRQTVLPGGQPPPVAPERPLGELDPEDVFSRLVQSRRGHPPSAELMTAFREVVSVLDDDADGLDSGADS